LDLHRGTSILTFGSKGSNNGQFNHPRGIAISSLDNNIFVSDCRNHRIQVFTSSGLYLRKFGSQGSGPSQLSDPQGIALNSTTNQLYVADRGNRRIQIFNAGTGDSIGEIGSAQNIIFGKSLHGLALDPRGYLFVTETETCRVLVLDLPTSRVLYSFGSKGSAPGQFTSPSYVTISSQPGKPLGLVLTDGNRIHFLSAEFN